jgi:hypothetical protein
VAQPVPPAQVDAEHMGQGLGGLLLEAAEHYSCRCLAAVGPRFHPSVGRFSWQVKKERQQNEGHPMLDVNMLDLSDGRHAGCVFS